MGWGFLALPFTVPVNLLIVPAVLSLQKRFERHSVLHLINSVGFLLIVISVCVVWFSLY